MLRKKWSVLFILLTACALSVPFFVASRGQTSPGKPKPAAELSVVQDFLKEIKATFPIVEYSSAEISEPSRKGKGKKYGRIPVLYPNMLANTVEFVALDDWEVGLFALPAEKSQIIVLGKVVEAAAFLSDNKEAVYSEFKIEIEKVFKNNTAEKLKPGKYIFAEREGGIVRYPTGFETWSYIASQRMPTVQNKYLFFLSHNFPNLSPQERDLYILTAYQLKDGHVIPLDHLSVAKQYKGKGIFSFAKRFERCYEKTTRKSIN